MSAPLASSAARVSARSLYLPVPTMSRELSVMSPMRMPSGVLCVVMTRSTSAHELHDLELVTLGELRLLVRGARHDHPIALDRDRALIDPELAQEHQHRRARRDV